MGQDVAFSDLDPKVGDSDNTLLKKLLISIRNLVAALSGGAADDEYETTLDTLTSANADIPVGAKSWSVTAISGTVTVAGETLPVGSTVGGGSYGARGLKTAITVNATSGSALIAYDTFA